MVSLISVKIYFLATVALSLSYASQATTEAERTTGISIVNFSQTIGFMIGPGKLSFLYVFLIDHYRTSVLL